MQDPSADGASASVLEFLVKDFGRAGTRELALTWLNALFVAHCMPTPTASSAASSAAADSPLRIAAPDSPVSGIESAPSGAAATGDSAAEGPSDAVDDQTPARPSPTAADPKTVPTSAAAAGAGNSSSISPSTDLALVPAGGSSEMRSDPETSQPNAYLQVLMGLLEGLRSGTLSGLRSELPHCVNLLPWFNGMLADVLASPD